jgi:hypothetical protein
MTKAQTFLTELYEIDPALKEHEQELIQLIDALLEKNPGLDPDPAFVEMLRVKLRERGAHLSPAPRSSQRSVGGSFFHFLTMNRTSSTVLGVVLGVLITGPTVYYMMNPSAPGTTGTEQSDGKLFSYTVNPVSNRAFGDLTQMTPGGRGQGGGGGAPAMDSATTGVTNPASAMQEADGKMIAPPGDYVYTQYNYVYKGDDITMPQSDVSVLRRVKGNLRIPTGGLTSADLGVFSLGSFPGLTLDSVGVMQDRKNGYSIYVSARDSSINIAQNYEQWDHPESRCRDEKCYQSFRLKMSDVPSDDVLIGIADDFLKQYGFKLENIGAPFVESNWKISYEQATDQSQYYIPDQISVIYPYVLDGKEVHEEYGSKTGVSIGISIRDKKVAGVWNLYDQNYESSAYPAVTDKQQVLDFLAKYEKQNMDWMPKDQKIQTLDIELGTPTEGLIRMYKFENNTQEELFVPALIFPVTKRPTGPNLYFTREFVAVPLAKDLLEQRTGGGYPMPLDGPMYR